MFKKILIISMLIISIGTISYGASFSIATIQNTVDYLKQEGYLPNFSRTHITDDRNYINNNAFKSYGIITTSSRVFLVFSFNNTIDNKNSCQSWLLDGSNFRNNQNWGSISFDNVEMAYSPYGIPIFGIPANEIYDKNKPQFDFEPNYFQKVFYTGINDEFNALKYDYSISSWKLGTFEEIPDDVDKIIVELHLNDGGIALTDSFLTFTKAFNNGYFFINNDNLYVYSRYIKYNTKYNLLFYLYDDNNNFIESYQYNYVFFPTNAIIENGAVVNPGSGDYSVQDSTNDTIGIITDDSGIDSILDETFSGDIESFASDFGFTAFDNPFSTFLLHIVDSLYDALTVRQDVLLSADYMGVTFTLNSADFNANYQLKSFVSTLMIFIYLYYNYIFFNHLITLVEIGNVDDLIDLIGYDEFYDSNMM